MQSTSFPIVGTILAFLACSSVVAQPPRPGRSPGCYTIESIQGAYAVVGLYGPKVAMALGVRQFDGKGNFTGAFVLNQPVAGSTTGERSGSTGTQQGTYAVNCNGTGVMTRLTTSSLGVVSMGFDDFLITDAVERDGKLIATKIEDAQRIPSSLVPGGIFLTRSYTRRADGPSDCYTRDSLRGWYGVVVNYDVNLAMGLQPEWLDGQGNLTRTGINNQPVAGSPTGDRAVGNVTSRGTYTVNCNGIGEITRIVSRPDGTTATAIDDFMILESTMLEGGRLSATRILDMQRGPAVVGTTNSFVTRIHTLRPNATADWVPRLQALACGGGQNCRVSVSDWNYYLVNNIDSNAPVLVIGDGTVLMTAQEYMDARILAGL